MQRRAVVLVVHCHWGGVAARPAISTLYWLLVLEIFEVVLVETPLVIAVEIRKLKMGPLGGDNGGGKWTTSWLEYAHCSASLQAYSPLASGKAAAAQVRDRNWNWEKRILCPTIGVFGSDPGYMMGHDAC